MGLRSLPLNLFTVIRLKAKRQKQSEAVSRGVDLWGAHRVWFLTPFHPFYQVFKSIGLNSKLFYLNFSFWQLVAYWLKTLLQTHYMYVKASQKTGRWTPQSLGEVPSKTLSQTKEKSQHAMKILKYFSNQKLTSVYLYMYMQLCI